VCLASQFNFRDNIRFLSDLMAQSMRKTSEFICAYTGFESDGLVVKADACVPSADAVFLDDMNHSDPAIAIGSYRYNPGLVTEVLLYLMVEKVRRMLGPA
jgi:hypothetical protein